MEGQQSLAIEPAQTAPPVEAVTSAENPEQAPEKERPPRIPDKLFFRIGETAELLEVKPYVLRYWESEFPVISPEKSATGQRVYKKKDVETLLLIKHLLYGERYSIEGARRRIRELRREGELKNYKRENVLGGEEKLARQERVGEMQKEAAKLQQLLRKPLREIFRF